MINVMIADDNELVRDLLEDIVSEDAQLNVVGTAQDGEETLQKVKELTPDVLLLDVIMPKMDGLAALDRIKEEVPKEKQPVVLMVSAIGDEMITGDAIARGAAYYLMKPFSADNILKQIKHVYEMRNMRYMAHRESKNRGTEKNWELLESQVTEMLHTLGVPVSLKGYQYIRDGIMMYLRDKSLINSVTKIMYPEIAERYRTTSINVERGIRNAIQVAFDRGNRELLDEMFAAAYHPDRSKPPCTEFIAVVAEKVRQKAS